VRRPLFVLATASGAVDAAHPVVDRQALVVTTPSPARSACREALRRSATGGDRRKSTRAPVGADDAARRGAAPHPQ